MRFFGDFSKKAEQINSIHNEEEVKKRRNTIGPTRLYMNEGSYIYVEESWNTVSDLIDEAEKIGKNFIYLTRSMKKSETGEEKKFSIRVNSKRILRF